MIYYKKIIAVFAGFKKSFELIKKHNDDYRKYLYDAEMRRIKEKVKHETQK